MEPRTTEDGPQWGPREKLTLLNHHLRRVDGPEKVTGRARYTHDIRLPGMVYARLLLCPHPTAEVTLDCSPATKIPGVLLARGLGGRNTVKTGYLGQPVAVVAALTPELAEDGIRAIAAAYKVLPFALDEDQAVAEGAPKVRKNGNVGEARTKGDLADFEAALAGSAAKLEARYRLPVQHHCSLETHGVVVDFRGGEEATVYASTQGAFTIPARPPRPWDCRRAR
ncbi:MAG: xanthine dehydrogenase family protein molybdopterin-binding subunit [Planctomycetes bacterium]|nr:xanthine dehydrogenase family protein molybdopterin-binding subunit [Planctomycetota bacterium]